MRAYDEDDEEEFEDDEDEGLEERTSQIVGDLDVNMENDFDEYDEDGEADGDGEGDGDGDGDADGDDDEEEEDDGDQEQDQDDEDDDEVEADGDGDGDGDGEDEGDDDDEGEGDNDDDGGDEEEEGDGEDIDMANGEARSSPARSRSKSASRPRSPSIIPPHLTRRSLFVPPFSPASPPSSLSIEAVCAIPLPSPIHSLAATPCLSYLLTGSQEGYVRAYDFWGSVNGNAAMTAQQRSAVGFGEGVSKAGVARGWWGNEVAVDQGRSVNGSSGHGETAINGAGGGVEKVLEPVYSMQVESDGLWSLTGTRSGQINLFTLRHSPGHFITSLKGHSNVVSCMSLLPGETNFISGSWDGTLREWDLNTGQTVRTYPTHGAQISSISLRPLNAPSAPNSPRTPRAGDRSHCLNVSVRVGDDFSNAREDMPPSSPPASSTPRAGPQDDSEGMQVDEAKATTTDDASKGDSKDDEGKDDGDAATTARDEPSPYDPLFDDDAEGEDVPPSSDAILGETPGINDLAPPSPPAATTTKSFGASGASGGGGLALPGTKAGSGVTASANATAGPSSSASTAAPYFNLPSSTQTAPSINDQSSVAGSTAGPSRSGTRAGGIPLLSPAEYREFSNDVLLYSSMDGQVTLVDRRVPEGPNGGGVGRLVPGEKAPPWCMSACWTADGRQALAGRRNGTIDIWDVRKSLSSSSLSSPRLLRTLRTPLESGPISSVVAFPDGRHVASASMDNVRLWNTVEYFDMGPTGAAGAAEEEKRKKSSRPPFKIIAGHHGGIISSMLVDPACKFLITASGDRGWQGESTKVVLIHEIKY